MDYLKVIDLVGPITDVHLALRGAKKAICGHRFAARAVLDTVNQVVSCPQCIRLYNRRTLDLAVRIDAEKHSEEKEAL